MGVELAKIEDLEQIAEVYCNSFNSVSTEGWTKKSSKKLFEYWFKKQPDLFFVIKKGKKIIGGIVASAKPWFDGVRLQDGEIFVDPSFQRKGVGKKLLLKLVEEGIKNYHTNTFEAITFSNSEFPLSWYEKIGLKKSDDLLIITGSCQDLLNNLKK